MTIKVKVKDIEQFLLEVFGSKEVEPLLLKNLSQKTKFHLKRLGNTLLEERKEIGEEIQTLVKKYYTEVKKITSEDGTVKEENVLPESSREAFTKDALEMEEIVLTLQCYDFTEDDFIDTDTKQVVAGKNYYNLIDALIYFEPEVEVPAPPKNKLKAVK